jgi:hypothetical protein
MWTIAKTKRRFAAERIGTGQLNLRFREGHVAREHSNLPGDPIVRQFRGDVAARSTCRNPEEITLVSSPRGLPSEVQTENNWLHAG